MASSRKISKPSNGSSTMALKDSQCLLSDLLKSSFAIEDCNSELLQSANDDEFKLPDDDDDDDEKFDFERKWEQIANMEIDEGGDNHDFSPAQLAELVSCNKKAAEELGFSLPEEEIIKGLKDDQEALVLPSGLSNMKEIVLKYLSRSTEELEESKKSLERPLLDHNDNSMETEDVCSVPDKLRSASTPQQKAVFKPIFTPPPPPAGPSPKTMETKVAFVAPQQTPVTRPSGMFASPQLPPDIPKKSETRSSNDIRGDKKTVQNRFLISRTTATKTANSVISPDNLAALTMNKLDEEPLEGTSMPVLEPQKPLTSSSKVSNPMVFLPLAFPTKIQNKSETESLVDTSRVPNKQGDKKNCLISGKTDIGAPNVVIVPGKLNFLNEQRTSKVGNKSSNDTIFKIPNGKMGPPPPKFPKPNIFVLPTPKIILPMSSTAKFKFHEQSLSPQSGDPLEPSQEFLKLPPPPPLLPIILPKPSTTTSSKQNENLDMILKCEFCPEKFSSYDDNLFRKHLLIKHSFEIEKDTYFVERLELSTLPRKPINHSCGFCGKVFTARYDLQRHIQVSHQKFLSKAILYPGFRCSQCLKGFGSSFELTNHCLMCFDLYPNSETLRDLAKSYLNCDICAKKHSNTEEASICYCSTGILRCPLCLDIFRKKDSFGKHLHMYHGLQFKDSQGKLGLPCPFCFSSNAKWGRYQDIFPHIVAEHFQTNIDAINVVRGSPLVKQGEPGMPVVTSVCGNYSQA